MMQTYPGNGGVGDTDRCRWAPASLSRMSSRWNQQTPFIHDTILKVCTVVENAEAPLKLRAYLIGT